MLLLISLACTPTPPPAPAGELTFVRDAVIAPAGTPGQTLPDGSVLVDQDWTPGQPVTVGGITATAPARAECRPLFSVALGDVSRLVAMGGAAPNTAMAFSPDGATLAIGSYRGELMVVDGWSGAVQARRSLAETMVKQVAWSPDGQTLYAAEQSPDAFVHAMDPATLQPRWSLRLADIVGSSAPPDAEDLYGVYTLPGAYALEVLPDGELLVSALHSWNDETGSKRNRSQLLRVGPDGKIRGRWPAQPADATFQHVAVDGPGGVLAVTVNQSAAGDPPTDLPIGGVAVLELPALTERMTVVTPPLTPWFDRTFIWNGLDVSAEQDALYMGFGDGRVRAMSLSGEPVLELNTGAPIMAGEVPIHASVGWGFLHDDGLLYSTSTTLIPYGAASPSLRPPTAHPAENTLWSMGRDGQTRWSWSGPQRIEGLSLGPERRALVVGAGDRKTDDRRDLYGAMIFDLTGPARSGEERLEAFCQTAGPVFFRQHLAADGRLALAEHPYTEGDGSIVGSYQVTVMR